MANLLQGLQPNFALGNVTVPLGMAIILSASGSTVSNYDVLKLNGVAYQVPTGFKLRLVACRVSANAATACTTKIFYGDNAISDAATTPTNNVNLPWGGSSVNIGAMTQASIGSYFEIPLPNWEIPAGKYPHMSVALGASTCIFLGYLVAV